VVSGLFAFLARAPDLVPFAIFPNKIFLCRLPFMEFYRKGCREVLGFALHKSDLELQNHPVDVYEDRWPHLTRRLADPNVAAAAQADIRAIEDSGLLIKRPMIAHPGDRNHAAALLRYSQTLLARERRRAEVLENKVERATLEANEMLSSTSWRVTAPLRWLRTAMRR